jgi:hypothetical protein
MTFRDGLEPSSFALDVHFANGRSADAALEQHVAGCARCSAYLSSLTALSAQPGWGAPARQRSERLTAGKAAALFAASALTLGLVWLGLRPQRRSEYVAGKGVPAVQALIRDQSGSRVWDGNTRIHAGDAIALRAACERFTHVAVLVASAGSQQRVFDAACPSGSDPLPFTLVADAKPGVERIVVVFSHVQLDDASLQAALRSTTRDAAIWVDQLALHKAVSKP